MAFLTPAMAFFEVTPNRLSSPNFSTSFGAVSPARYTSTRCGNSRRILSPSAASRAIADACRISQTLLFEERASIARSCIVARYDFRSIPTFQRAILIREPGPKFDPYHGPHLQLAIHVGASPLAPPLCLGSLELRRSNSARPEGRPCSTLCVLEPKELISSSCIATRQQTSPRRRALAAPSTLCSSPSKTTL